MVPGGPITCTATYTVTQADVDTGSIANTVTVTAAPVSGGEVTATDDLTIDTDDPAPAASLVKTADVTNPAVGDVVTYSFEVANTGNVTLTGVRVTDPLPGLSPVDCGSGNNLIATLAPADPPVTCTATYTVTQADVDRGGITNTATATGTPPPGSPPLTPPQSGTGVPITRDPAVQVVKSTDATTDLVVGQLITYTFSVSNTGNVTVRNVTVTDTLVAPSAINCDGDNVITSIAPGAPPVECTATYTVTQADADAGSVDNTVTITATPPAGLPPVSDTDTVTSPIDPAPALTLVKTAVAPDPVTVGDEITYTLAVTNSGNVTLTDVTVTDPLVGLSAIDCGGDGDNVIASFAPGGPITCTATYTVTQADVDAGSVSNTATATGTPPPGSPPLTPPTDTVDVPIDRTPALSIVKSSDVVEPEPLVAGDVVTFEFSVTNTGNTTLTNVTVTDVLDGLSAISCAGGTNVIATMDPGDNVECTATYTVTQDDVDNGTVLNEATVTGTPPTGLDPPSDTDDHATPFPPVPGIALEKTADFTAPLSAGDEITYMLAVTNTGNVSLTAITVTDDLVDESAIDCGDGTNVIARMAPGGPRVCTVTYIVTQDDIDAGGVTNTASVTGNPPFGLPPETDDATADVPIPPQPALTLDKSALADEPVATGDTVTYEFEVTNTGNVTLSAVTVSDPLVGDAAIDCGDGTNVIATLAPDDGPVTCTATYTVTQADVDNGTIVNVASATGTPPGSDQPLTPVQRHHHSRCRANLGDDPREVLRRRPRRRRRGRDHLLVHGREHRHRHADRRHGQRPTRRALGHRLRWRVADDRHPAARRSTGDVHGDVHRHPGRRRQRRRRQHGDRHRLTARERSAADPADVDTERPDRSPAGVDARQVGRPAERRGSRRGDHLLVRGDQHRQRHDHRHHRQRPPGRTVAHRLRRRDADDRHPRPRRRRR